MKVLIIIVLAVALILSMGLGGGISVESVKDSIPSTPIAVVPTITAATTAAVAAAVVTPEVTQIAVIPKPRPTIAPTELPTVAPAIPLGKYKFIDKGIGSATPRYCLQRPDLGLEICDQDISMTYPVTQEFLARALELHQVKGSPMVDQ